jgi:hypothetical protein
MPPITQQDFGHALHFDTDGAAHLPLPLPRRFTRSRRLRR